MNSTKIIQDFVDKVIKVTDVQAFNEHMELLGTLKCYIDDIENHKDPTYNILFEFFGEAMNFPLILRHNIASYCDNKLEHNKYNFFITYKLCYVKMLLDDPSSPNNSSKGINKKKIRAIEELLKKADLNDDTCLFNAAKYICKL